jgi:magnesium transporter
MTRTPLGWRACWQAVPGIVYLADAIGTQTETLTIGGMSVGIRVERAFFRELMTGFFIGLILATIFIVLVLRAGSGWMLRWRSRWRSCGELDCQWGGHGIGVAVAQPEVRSGLRRRSAGNGHPGSAFSVDLFRRVPSASMKRRRGIAIQDPNSANESRNKSPGEKSRAQERTQLLVIAIVPATHDDLGSL